MSRWFRAIGVTAALAVGILLFYLSVYAVRGYDQPLGYDTARYLWRTNCVAAGGLAELRRCARPAEAALPSRVGYPLISLQTSSILGTSRYALAAVIPIVAGVAIALAGAALLSWSLGLSAGRFAVLVVVLGASPMIVAMASPEGYADTMLATAIGLAGLMAVALALQHGRGSLAAGALFAGAALVHSPTALVFAAILLVTAVVYLPRARSDSARGMALSHTTSARIAGVAGWAVLLWVVGLVVAVRSAPDTFHVPAADLAEKLRSHLPRLGLPVAVPAAALGVYGWVRGFRRDPSRRGLVLTILLVWIGVVAAALIAWFAGWNLPAHRFLLLSLPLPLLGAVGLLWVGDVVGDRVVSGLVVVGGCAAVVAAGYWLWTHNAPPMLRSARLDQAKTASAYTASIPQGTTVSVVVDLPGVNPDALRQTFRVTLPESRIRIVRFPDKVPARVLTQTEGPVLLVDGYSASFRQASQSRPEQVVAPGVLVVRGPTTSTSGAIEGPRLRAGVVGLVAVGLAMVALLVALGFGWTTLSMAAELRPFERLAASPAIGLAVLVLTGLVLDGLGFAAHGVPAVIGVIAAGCTGGALTLRNKRLI